MTLTLTPEAESRIRALVESVHCPDWAAVIGKAREALEEQEQAKLLRPRELVRVGFESGPAAELTDVVWEEIEREADEADRLGLPIRREVQP